jgi:hypothetical protein
MKKIHVFAPKNPLKTQFWEVKTNMFWREHIPLPHTQLLLLLSLCSHTCERYNFRSVAPSAVQSERVTIFSKFIYIAFMQPWQPSINKQSRINMDAYMIWTPQDKILHSTDQYKSNFWRNSSVTFVYATLSCPYICNVKPSHFTDAVNFEIGHSSAAQLKLI